MHWGAVSGIVLALITALNGQVVEGRLGIPRTDLSNPNDLALMLLITGLFVATLALSDLALVRLIPLAVVPLMVYYILQTGSRANFVTLVVLLFTSIYVAPKRVKIALVVLSPILAGAMFFTVSPETRQRLLMIVSDPESRLMSASATDLERGAIGSQYARTKLQERAIDLTLRHPVLGVGPLMFADAVEEMVREEEGQKSGWQFAHNVYLQMAAENGVIGFLIFVGIMLWLLGANFKTYRASGKDLRHRAYGRNALLLLLVSVCFSVGIAFGNYIYDPGFPILVGLTAANLLSFRAARAATSFVPRAA
jgi:O-antigen ligase